MFRIIRPALVQQMPSEAVTTKPQFNCENIRDMLEALLIYLILSYLRSRLSTNGDIQQRNKEAY